MALRGKCPGCYRQHELEPQDLGRIFECRCGLVLLSCDRSSFSSIQVVCESCKKRYRLRLPQERNEVPCKCGSNIQVPEVVLQKPVTVLRAEEPLATTLRPVDDQTLSLIPEQEFVIDVGLDDGDAEVESASPAVIHDHEANSSKKNTKRVDKKSTTVSTKQSRWGSWAITTALIAFFAYSILMFINRNDVLDAKISNDVAEETNKKSGKTSSSDVPIGSGRAIEAADLASKVNQSRNLPKRNLPTLPTDSRAMTVLIEEVDFGAGSSGGDTIQLNLPLPTVYTLPKARVARERVEVIRDSVLTGNLKRSVELAFESYQQTQELAPELGGTPSKKQIADYRSSLGKTIGLVEKVHQIAIQQSDKQNIMTMRYLLAFLSLQAGHLPEAMIYGQSVARHGVKEDPASLESAMIALAAAQEACGTHWGVSNQLSELSTMVDIISLIEERWPEDKQISEMWMNVAHLYEAFNQPRIAILCYDQVKKNEELFSKSKISSGLIAWRLSRKPELARVSSESFSRLNHMVLEPIGDTDWGEQAITRLTEGIIKSGVERQPEQDQVVSLSMPVFEATLALSQLYFMQKKYQQASKTLRILGDVSLLDRSVTTDSSKAGKRLYVSESKLVQLFDLFIAISRNKGAIEETQSLLTQMSKMASTHGRQIESTSISLLKEAMQKARASAKLEKAKVDQITRLTDAVMTEVSTVPTENLLWIGESWGQIGTKAESVDLKQSCCSKAAELYQLAMQRTDFPESSLQTARIRQVDLLGQANQSEQAILVLNDLLAKAPNILALQIKAAEILQGIAERSGRREDFEAASNGPTGFSAIWGWGRLVTSLHAIRWGPNGTDIHAYQLLNAQYHLAECRYSTLVRSPDSSGIRLEIASLERSIKTIVATLEDDNDWKIHFGKLLEIVSGS